MVCLFISGKAIYFHLNNSLKVRSRYNSQRTESEPAANKVPHTHALSLPWETAMGH